MEQGYLTRESQRVNKATRKTLFKLIVVLVCAVALIYFLGRSEIDFSDMSFGSIPFFLVIGAGLVFISTAVRLFTTSRAAVNGANLVLPYSENTREAVAEIIDKEALDGNILVEEYIEKYTDREKARGEKIVLTPSYLLHCAASSGMIGTSKVTAIPREKIYWVCAQVGRKGGPFVVKLLVFAEGKIFGFEAGDPEHIKNLADMLYQHIPNIFSAHDPFVLSYLLEESFSKEPAEFMGFYQMYQTNWDNDRRLCDRLRQQGDPLTAPREVDFFIYFQNAADMDAAAAKLSAQGFTVADCGQREDEEEEDDGLFGLNLTMVTIPELSSINRITSGILRSLTGMNADFDGWGCSVVIE